jgi:hypothetical protein
MSCLLALFHYQYLMMMQELASCCLLLPWPETTLPRFLGQQHRQKGSGFFFLLSPSSLCLCGDSLTPWYTQTSCWIITKERTKSNDSFLSKTRQHVIVNDQLSTYQFYFQSFESFFGLARTAHALKYLYYGNTVRDTEVPVPYVTGKRSVSHQ